MRRFLLLLALLLMLGGLAAGGWIYARAAYDAPGPLAEPAQLVVPRGGSTAIAEALAARGVIADPRAFLAAAWMTGGDGPLRAAEFAFPARASLREVFRVLRHARPVQRRLTIPEGLTARQIAALLDRADGLAGETPSFEEGALLPETYAYEFGAARASIVRRADQAWMRRWPRPGPPAPRDCRSPPRARR